MLNVYIHSGFDYQGCVWPFALLILANMDKAELNRTTPSCSRGSLLVLMFLVICWVFGKILQMPWLQYLIMLSMLPALIAICLGLKTIRILGFTLCCLPLLLPYGQTIFIESQNLFASLLVKMLSPFHNATYWDGNSIYVNNNQYVISSMFISMQYIMSYLSIGAICAALFRRGVLIRLRYTLFFAFTIFIVLTCTFTVITMLQIPIQTFQLQIISWTATIISISLTIRNGYKTKFKYATTHDIDWQNAYPQQNTKIFTTVSLAMLLLITNNAFKRFDFHTQYADHSSACNFKTLPEWGTPIAITEAQQKHIAEYKKNKQSIFIATSGSEVANTLEDMAGADWHTIKVQRSKINIFNKKILVTETIMRKDGISRIIWTIKAINGKYISDRRANLFLEKLHILYGQPINARTTSIATHVDTDLNAGRETLTTFLQDYMLE